MNNSTLRKTVSCALCVCLAMSTAFHTGLLSIHAVSEETADLTSSVSLKGELSKNGNNVTEYVNDEDKQLKTILWAKGITPPKMGGADSQFEKKYTYTQGKVDYIEYIAPYLPGNGWYDVNKSKDFVLSDMNLCFAAAASNSLHWWMDRNAKYIDQYLEKNPDDPQIQKLHHLRNSFQSQQKSGVYDVFLRQFAGKKDGYWPDILQDQFINGYYLTPNGATNDSPAAEENLLNKGPDKNGGFFFEVFKTHRLTQRRNYDNGYDAINQELKALLLEGNSVMMTYTVGARNHVVTLWGAEFDPNGNICGVYYTDSDDDGAQGMMRFQLVNIDGKAVVTTKADGTGNSKVVCLQVLSQGTKQWDTYLQGSPKTLDLVWSNTKLMYNGQAQVPTVTAANIENGDTVTLSVEGAQTNAGTYTATAVLSGPDADKYALPADHTCAYEIQKAPAPQIQYPQASALTYGQKLSAGTLTGGSVQFGSFHWENGDTIPVAGSLGYPVLFVPSAATVQNYEPMTSLHSTVPVTVHKATPNIAFHAEVAHTTDFHQIALSATLTSCGYGTVPTGTITFVVADENGEILPHGTTTVPVKDGKAAALWNGTESGKYTVQAHYSGSTNYRAVSAAAVSVDLQKKAQDPLVLRPVGTKTYGDADFTLSYTGGSGHGAVSYVSSDPDILRITGNTVTILKAGTATITVTKAADATYQEAKASISVVVNKKQVTVRAENKTAVVQGSPLPTLTYTVEGLVNEDRFTDPKLTTALTDTHTPGVYDIAIRGGNLTNAESYTIMYVNGQLTIQEKEAAPDPTQPSAQKPAPTEAPLPHQPSATNSAKPTEPAQTQPSHAGTEEEKNDTEPTQTENKPSETQASESAQATPGKADKTVVIAVCAILMVIVILAAVVIFAVRKRKR